MKTTRFSAHLIQTKELTDSWADNPFADVTEGFVDEEQKIIKNVCIFGKRESLNGYVYEPQAVTTLAKLATNARFFIDHPSKSEIKERDGVRSVRDWAGMFSNPRKENDKVFADLHVRPIFWDLVKDVAMMKPAGIGNSINSVVKVFKDGKGKESILDIERLKSIDLVASAATTLNLFESLDMSKDKGIEVEEGILKDKLMERKKMDKISTLNYEAMDLMREIMRDNAKNIKTKKEEISSLMSDLEEEVTSIMAEKDSGEEGNISSSHPEMPMRASTKEEEEVMDYKLLSIELLNKERPDLIKELVDKMENSKKTQESEKELGDLRAKVVEIEKSLVEMKAASEALKKENDELKVKVDKYESQEKKAVKEALIAKKIEAAKLPKEAISEVFMSDLLKKDEKEIEESIKDRLALWSTKPPVKVQKNAGAEFVDKVESTTVSTEEVEKKRKDDTEKFLSKMNK